MRLRDKWLLHSISLTILIEYPFLFLSGFGINVARWYCHRSVHQLKKLDLVHQTISPRERVGSGDETSITESSMKHIPSLKMFGTSFATFPHWHSIMTLSYIMMWISSIPPAKDLHKPSLRYYHRNVTTPGKICETIYGGCFHGNHWPFRPS